MSKVQEKNLQNQLHGDSSAIYETRDWTLTALRDLLIPYKVIMSLKLSLFYYATCFFFFKYIFKCNEKHNHTADRDI